MTFGEGVAIGILISLGIFAVGFLVAIGIRQMRALDEHESYRSASFSDRTLWALVDHLYVDHGWKVDRIARTLTLPTSGPGGVRTYVRTRGIARPEDMTAQVDWPDPSDPSGP